MALQLVVSLVGRTILPAKFTLARGKSDDDLFIVVYSDSMHQKVPIEVTMSTYINHDVGEYIEFDLDQFDIDRALNY